MIDRLVAIRVTEQTALADARRAMAARPEWKREVLTGARGGGVFEEAALLATCERLELYGILSDTDALREFDPRAEASGSEISSLREGAGLIGERAAEHLLRVAAGLDSRIVGETHVLGQVTSAYREAEALLSTGPILAAVFESATRAGRRVRAETQLGRLAGSYVSAAVERTQLLASGIGAIRVGVLGSGALARQLVEELAAAGFADMRVFARHTEHASHEIGDAARIYPLHTLAAALSALDVVIAATSSPRALVSAADLVGSDQRARPLTFIDLGMPANIDADVTTHAGAHLIGLTDLAGSSHSAATIAEAEGIVGRELDRLTRKLARLNEKRRAAAWA